MRLTKKILIATALFLLFMVGLFSCNIIWKSPQFYDVRENRELTTPIIDMETYKQKLQTHRRPYCYSIQSTSKGKVYIIGVQHLRDQNHSQFDTIRSLWSQAKPTVALVEGRLGFLFTWFQDPIEEYGEGGLVSQLAKNDGIKLFTWEPTRNDEIEILMKQFPIEQIAMFYSFRPYFSNMRHGKPQNPENKLQEYLKSRTDYNHVRDIFKSWTELDSVWQKDFPNINWRDYSDEHGWPKGYLYDIWNASNLVRDYHLVQIIAELVENGETVYVTMGSSHAPRIEATLKNLLE